MMLQLNLDAILSSIGPVTPAPSDLQATDFASLVIASSLPASLVPDPGEGLDQSAQSGEVAPAPEPEHILAVISNTPSAEAPFVEMPTVGKEVLRPAKPQQQRPDHIEPQTETLPVGPNPNAAIMPSSEEVKIGNDGIERPRLKRLASQPIDRSAYIPQISATPPKPIDQAPVTDQKPEIGKETSEIGQPVAAKPFVATIDPMPTFAFASTVPVPVPQNSETATDPVNNSAVQVRAKAIAQPQHVEKRIDAIMTIAQTLPDAATAATHPLSRALQDVVEPILPNITTDAPARIIAPTLRSDLAGDVGSQTPDRGASLFSAHVTALARDVVAVGAERDVRFNVRPEALGPVSVTIERRDDGAALRLGVETPVAMQAVRQAEPALNDAAARSGSPFVQVSVDLNSPGQRNRSAHAAAHIKRGHDDTPLPMIEQAAAKSGRFA